MNWIEVKPEDTELIDRIIEISKYIFCGVVTPLLKVNFIKMLKGTGIYETHALYYRDDTFELFVHYIFHDTFQCWIADRATTLWDINDQTIDMHDAYDIHAKGAKYILENYGKKIRFYKVPIDVEITPHINAERQQDWKNYTGKLKTMFKTDDTDISGLKKAIPDYKKNGVNVTDKNQYWEFELM